MTSDGSEPAPLLFDFGDWTVRLPVGWSVVEKCQMLFLGSHELRSKVALCRVILPATEDVPEGPERTPFRGADFSGYLEVGEVVPSFLERILFRRQSHHRLEWIVASGDGLALMAVYLAEPDEERARIKDRVGELLRGLRCEGTTHRTGEAADGQAKPGEN